MSTIPHPAAGGFVSAFVDNPIFLPGKDPVFAPATLKSGQVYKAGSVLGRITSGAATAAAKSGGNGSANGTFVIDGTNPSRKGAKVGVYTLRCVVAPVNTVHAGIFQLKDPDGFLVDQQTLLDSGGTITFDNDIKGVLTDGGTNFALGDGFDITVPAGSGKLTLAVATAQDGSSEPVAILGEQVDASGADKSIPVMVEGYFNEEALIYGAGHTADTVRVALRKLGIHIRTMKYSG